MLAIEAFSNSWTSGWLLQLPKSKFVFIHHPCPIKQWGGSFKMIDFHLVLRQCHKVEKVGSSPIGPVTFGLLFDSWGIRLYPEIVQQKTVCWKHKTFTNVESAPSTPRVIHLQPHLSLHSQESPTMQKWPALIYGFYKP